MRYDIAKEKGGRYYVTDAGVIVPGTYGDKKKVLHLAAKLEGVSYKDYLKLRRQTDDIS